MNFRRNRALDQRRKQSVDQFVAFLLKSMAEKCLKEPSAMTRFSFLLTSESPLLENLLCFRQEKS